MMFERTLTMTEVHLLLMQDGLCYLATPYTKYEGGIDLAAEHAAKLAGYFMQSGIPVFCPIAHCHWIAKSTKLDPIDGPFWLRTLIPFMKLADYLVIAKMPGWGESDGINYETEYFTRVGKSIYHLEIGDFLKWS